MYQYLKIWLELRFDRRAVTALEYGLIAATVVAIGLAGFNVIGTNAAAKMTKVKASVT